MERSNTLLLPMAAIVLAAVAGCGGDRCGAGPGILADLHNFPQDCTAYLDAPTADIPLISPQRQQEMARQLGDEFFAAWKKTSPTQTIGQVRKAFDECARPNGFGQNTLPLDPQWAKRLEALADLSGYPNMSRRGIVVRTASLRGLPTDRPKFDDFAQAGGGWPFDTLQYSLVWAATPVFVCHASRDGGWLLIETPVGAGWMHAQDVAYVDDPQILAWRNLPLVAITTENTALLTDKGAYWADGRIGMLLPLVAQNRDAITVAIVTRGPDGMAAPGMASIATRCAAVVPLAMTAANLAAVANQMIGQPYGWGGMYDDRDCSSTTRDLFAPFGLALPRNSSQQAAAGRVIPLGHLPPAQREKVLLEQGKPWLTLVRAPGHIMLYIGKRDTEAMVYQSFWGIKTQIAGREGRRVAGICGITTLQAGRERTDLLLSDQRSRIESIVILGE